LIHAEAGGFSGYVSDRTPYHVARVEGPVMTAPSVDSWDALRDYLWRYVKEGATL
jgi:hypothetical protein